MFLIYQNISPPDDAELDIVFVHEFLDRTILQRQVHKIHPDTVILIKEDVTIESKVRMPMA